VISEGYKSLLIPFELRDITFELIQGIFILLQLIELRRHFSIEDVVYLLLLQFLLSNMVLCLLTLVLVETGASCFLNET
jgi:hypothetical protein